MVAARLANMTNGGDRPSRGDSNFESANLHSRNQITREEAADMLNVSKRTVNAAAKVKDEGTPELVRAVESGTASVSAAAQVATLPIEEQREIVSQGPQAIVEAAKAVREGKSPHVAHNSGNNEWYTPVEYIEAAREVLGGIDLDPASSDIANQTVQATHYFTAEVDGLAHEWSGRVWMNPPYSSDLIGQFISKLIQHYDAGKIEAAIVLVNNATETKWFQELAQNAYAICFPKGRIKYLDSSGTPANAPLQGQAFIYFGENADLFKAIFQQFGVVLFV
jgi:ParB family chromosome partitioning protein